MTWHNVKVLAHGLKGADSPLRYCCSELQYLLADAREKGR